MVNVCCYFQVHQPIRMKQFSVFDIGKSKGYFDDHKNQKVMEKVARKCYIPTNDIIYKMIKESNGEFKVAYSLTGTAIDQFKEYCPHVLESFQRLHDTGNVEFLSETYYHSLSFLYSKKEFKDQVKKHTKAMKELFGTKPKVFRNTELIFNNELGKFVEGMGYKAVLAEGASHILDWRSPNFVYKPGGCDKIKLLLKNYKLSDDIAFRFSNKSWKEYPLTSEKYASWLENLEGDVVNLFMDYETFGEHQWADTGIFNFLRNLPGKLLKKKIGFSLPSQLAELEAKEGLDFHDYVSWADIERDLSAWRGNKIQESALSSIYGMEGAVRKSKDKQIIDDWRKLQTSDHFYYMCTKWFNDGDVHKYFNPYDSPYDGYIAFMNVMNDLKMRLDQKGQRQLLKQMPLVNASKVFK
ncbi:MAG: glycoside hydrolase family 57 protein [Candidatus Woesearchaeota archaeon]|nr:glycoside hydrolase family 57 protein [Candidatus Woesearchaeota archaeon]MDP7323531.1 glycoside hydrolase family 57 protein [Candidatus Woesearchaeota archaeon]